MFFSNPFNKPIKSKFNPPFGDGAAPGVPLNGEANLSGTGTMVATAHENERGAAALTGAGTMVATAHENERGAATMVGSGTMAAAGTLSNPSAGNGIYAWGVQINGTWAEPANNAIIYSPTHLATSISFLAIGNSLSTGNTVNAIKSDGTLWGWGNSGQCGVTDPLANGNQIYSPTQIGTKTDWVQLSVGNSACAAIDGSHQLWTWGPTNAGGLGTAPASPIQVGTATDWAKVHCGLNVGVAVKSGGTLWTWGAAAGGALANGTSTPNLSSPVQIGILTDWADAKVSSSFGIAVKSTGTLWTWGTDTNGRLGDGIVARSSPVQIGTLTNWSKIALGSQHWHAIKADGTLWGCGANTNGQLGDGTNVSKSSPVQIGTASNWTAIVANPAVSIGTMAKNSNGEVYVWGANLSWQLAVGDFVNHSAPVLCPSLSNMTLQDFSATPYLLDSGILVSWGNTGISPSINPWPDDLRQLPHLVLGSKKGWIDFGVANDTTGGPNAGAWVGVKSDGTLWGLGINKTAGTSFALTSQPSTIGFAGDTIMSPVMIDSGTTWASVVGGLDHFLALKSDGTLWVWGMNAGGALGVGDTLLRSTIVQVGTLSNWAMVVTSSDGNTSGGIDTSGHLFTWGGTNGTAGILGDGTILGKNSPVQIGTLTNWRNLSVSVDGGPGGHFMATKTDGTLWGWGMSNGGCLGDGTSVAKSSPIQIGTLTDWLKVSCGTSFTAAIKSNGTLWTWGIGGNGQLGDGTTSNRSSPVQVGTLTDWADVNCHLSTVVARKTDGSVWGWGNGANAMLGVRLGSATSGAGVRLLSSPVQIGSFTTIAKVIAAGNCMFAMETP